MGVDDLYSRGMDSLTGLILGAAFCWWMVKQPTWVACVLFIGGAFLSLWLWAGL